MRETNAQKYNVLSLPCEAADAGSVHSLVLFVHWVSISSALSSAVLP